MSRVGWVFPNPTTLKPYWQESVCADHIKPAAVKAGLGTNIGWHTFLHTFRTWSDSTGAPIAMKRELMRHASIETTMNVYGRAVIASGKQQGSSDGPEAGAVHKSKKRNLRHGPAS